MEHALAVGALIGFIVVAGLGGGIYFVFLAKPSKLKKLIGGLCFVAQLGVSFVLLNQLDWPRDQALWMGVGLIGTTFLLSTTLRIFLKDP